ncbi:MAG: cation:proton antiporter [Spirochaetales bacterium]|nr:cation:proton antiporter [Spirochaetales bacterium]
MALEFEILIGVLFLCCFLCIYRIARGPTAPDRTVGIDILGIVIVGFCGVLAVITGKDFFINVALTWALLSFIGTIALAKYLEGRSFDE